MIANMNIEYVESLWSLIVGVHMMTWNENESRALLSIVVYTQSYSGLNMRKVAKRKETDYLKCNEKYEKFCDDSS